MSKIETLRNYAKHETNRQILSLADAPEMIRQVRQMREELQGLPIAIATETASALEPLTRLQMDVQKILAAYEQIAAAQRQTLDELTSEMADRATAALQSQTTSISEQVIQLQTNIRDIQKTMDHISRLPSDLANSYHNATTATERLISEADRLKPNPLKTAAMLIMAGVISGAIALAGMTALNAHQQPNAHNGAWAQRLWQNATPAQRSALTQIESGHAK